MASADVARPRLRAAWRTAAVATRLVRIDARRPAAWVSLGAAAMVGRSLVAMGDSAAELVPAVAIACGGLLAGAALDAPRSGLPDGRRRPWLTAWLLEVAWPIVGACAAVALAGGHPAAAAFLAAAAIATTAAACAATAAGVVAPAALVVSLALAGAGAGAALITGIVGSAAWPVQAAAAAAAWAVLAAAAWATPRDEAVWSWSAATSDGHGPAGSRRLPTVGLPTPLVVAALASSLAAMVLCFFLAPAFETIYAAVAGGWFLCLAVPPATTGIGGTAGRRLSAAAPGWPAVPGSISRAIAASIWILTVLGWPAVVALVLPAADGSRGTGPLLALVVLVGLGLMLLAATGLPGRRGSLARSLVLAAAAVAAAGLPGLPPLPWQPWAPRSGSVLSPGGDPARLPIRRSRLGLSARSSDPRWLSRIDAVGPDNTFSRSRRS